MSGYDVEHPQGTHVPRQAPPLVLLHGSGASGGSRGPVVPGLAGHRHAVRVDLPGRGRSAPWYGVPALADRVAALLDDLGLRRVAVVGRPGGGYGGARRRRWHRERLPPPPRGVRWAYVRGRRAAARH